MQHHQHCLHCYFHLGRLFNSRVKNISVSFIHYFIKSFLLLFFLLKVNNREGKKLVKPFKIILFNAVIDIQALNEKISDSSETNEQEIEQGKQLQQHKQHQQKQQQQKINAVQTEKDNQPKQMQHQEQHQQKMSKGNTIILKQPNFLLKKQNDKDITLNTLNATTPNNKTSKRNFADNLSPAEIEIMTKKSNNSSNNEDNSRDDDDTMDNDGTIENDSDDNFGELINDI